MQLKETDCLLLEISHLSIDKSNNITDHESIWKAFKIGIEYQKQLVIEKNSIRIG